MIKKEFINYLSEFQVKEFLIGEEEKFLLRPVGKGFDKFIRDFTVFLNNLTEKLSKKANTNPSSLNQED